MLLSDKEGCATEPQKDAEKTQKHTTNSNQSEKTTFYFIATRRPFRPGKAMESGTRPETGKGQEESVESKAA